MLLQRIEDERFAILCLRSARRIAEWTLRQGVVDRSSRTILRFSRSYEIKLKMPPLEKSSRAYLLTTPCLRRENFASAE